MSSDEIKRLNKKFDELYELAKDMYDHLEYSNWGDSWENECARDSGLIKQADNYFATRKDDDL